MGRITKAPDERRSELIATAQQLFYTQGYESTSVNDIVKTVGVAKGTFYYYFDSKVEILEAMVAELTAQSIAVMHEIVIDESLSAIEKWQRAFLTTAAWKVAHRDELLAVLRVIHSPDNILLRHKMEEQTIAEVTPEVAKIIWQGIEEGVFETGFAVEGDDTSLYDTAEIAFSIMRTLSTFFAEVLLNPEAYPNAVATVQRKVAAIQTAIERVLGAPQGSLPLIDEDSLAAWLK